MTAHIDLHIHTHHSDGAISPQGVIERVVKKGLVAFSITDHDSIDGFREARQLLGEDGPELITGVELSVSRGDIDPHILAYGFDPDDEVLNKALADFRILRNHRGSKMVEKLNGLGLEISMDDVLKCSAGATVGRPHVARALAERGSVESYEEAFVKYLATGKPAYVPKENLPAEEAIGMVHRAGGITVLAHPIIEDTFRFLEELMELGLDGVEAYHPSHRQSDCDRIKEAAKRLNIIVTGGSDFHSLDHFHGAIGSQQVPVGLLDDLKERCQQRRDAN